MISYTPKLNDRVRIREADMIRVARWTHSFTIASLTVALMLLCSRAGAQSQEAASTADGEALFTKNGCVVCHNGAPDQRAPSVEALKTHSPESVILALTGGVMRGQGAHLTGAERRALAEFLTGKKLSDSVRNPNIGRCAAQPARFNETLPGWNGWSPTPENWHFQPAAQAGLTAADIPKLKLKWAFGYPDIAVAWGQPTVVSQRVYVGSQNGEVYMLDAKSGCTYWTYVAGAGVRTSIVVGPRKASGGVPAGHNAYFGDMNGFVYAVDADSGKLIWRMQVDDHPQVRLTGSFTLYDGRLYVPTASWEEMSSGDPKYECCTSRGSLSAVDAATGKVIWKTYPIADKPAPISANKFGTKIFGPSGGGIWTTPTLDTKRSLIYVGTGNTFTGEDQALTDSVLAIEMKTGKVRWSQRGTVGPDVSSGFCRFVDGCKNGPDLDFGATVVLGHLPNGKDFVFAGHKSGVGFGLDPDTGAVLWKYKAGVGGTWGGMEWGTTFDGTNVYFPNSDITDPEPGGLHAVDPVTGERVWYVPPVPTLCKGTIASGCSPAQSAAATAIPGAILSGAADGGMRAYSTKDGSIFWTYDTNRDYETVNGVPAKGASIIGPGPVVVGGMLFFNSGYGQNRGRAGNVLLAFGVD
jgi:polyvinyl alcohol dehydrogenase (cytochrome)